MKISICIIFSMAIGALQAQRLTEPVPSGEDPASMLELPPATVIDEGEKPASASEDEELELEEEGMTADEGEDTVKDEDEGIQIQVEKTAGKSGVRTQEGKVKIEAPWPAKPISVPPVGWKFAPDTKGSEPFRTQVELASGNTVDLSITPYMLVPISDGRSAIKISEPGYDAALQFAQENTLGVMLQSSLVEIENHEKNAADVIQRLQQLLSSLPRKE